MPGRTLAVNIVTTNAGVPSILEGDILIPLDAAHIGWLTALCMDTPDIIDEAFNTIKANLSVIAGIDPMMPDDDWWNEFNALMVIVQYQPALSALQQARHQAAAMMEATR